MTFLDDGDIMLASCSQDNLIRVWRIDKASLADESGSMDDNMKSLELTSNKFSVAYGGK